ncbi:MULTISPECIES: R3H domain-containing nucleic acid-binding protein [unclassified Synechocystis]|uniref:Jag family protein n=1 Tax=unclassified Synechocystis TaxID=2640012 RepID=UPI0004099184|nr:MULTISPECIES: R3H domain-containing nucleic acid-binding protein [unclassified Synechocystis]AIE72639.1 RNA-binding protein Jag [Synechocystis sp. PCC 6714]MCT0254695.1 protein jag [Synechocystis sp. CS-94]
MEKIVTQAQVWLEQLLNLMGFPSSVAIAAGKENTLTMGPWLVIDEKGLSPEQIERLLAENGLALDAIQYLLNASLRPAVVESSVNFTPITVELAEFRSRRQLELISLSETAAQRVRETHEPVEMADMTAADRRQVHSFFEGSQDLETESQGYEPHRRLVIRPRR